MRELIKAVQDSNWKENSCTMPLCMEIVKSLSINLHYSH
ncbi:unnamed protein product [Musa acuminata subsp. malaccensis]|uniref:(wild Malaysian banana) hypothetical protein n=1 Tax=Musa acuminata subsp. malaccensis TaxID=214687 RepID=A0A8D6ZSQ8_MUSAM|nr:unnamed protein product [Musa acuminata subsp. malaccensis]